MVSIVLVASVGPQVAAVFAGGFAPLLATALIGRQFDRYWLVASYIVLTSLITLAGGLWPPTPHLGSDCAADSARSTTR